MYGYNQATYTTQSNIVVRNTPQPGAYLRQPIPQQQQRAPQVRRIYSQKTTKNKSFLDMSNYLKSIGIKNSEFMLALIDPDLDGVDPYDPHLNAYYKQKILREVLCNYWYFLREVVRIPTAEGKIRFNLNRGNLAYNFCSLLNFNIFYEMSRQLGKTTSVVVRELYIYQYGSVNSNIAFLNRNMDGSKTNLQSLKDIRDALPDYLKFTERLMPDGSIDRGKNNTTEIVNPHNNNSIKAYASATNKAKAASLLRGKTITSIYYDEYAFLAYNDIIYLNSAPAFKTASASARAAGRPYGITITTTPGFMSSEEGRAAFEMKETATKFTESWYDMSYLQIKTIIDANTSSDFVYVKFSYQQLGQSEEWFSDLCRLLKNDWPSIRREILLEWSTSNENSPFKEEDLNTISGLIRQPINISYILGKYPFETYLQADTRTFPAIIGVDVSAGLKQDSSTITIIDSQTTKVLGCMNCNYISTLDLANVIAWIVKNWMPNAVVNVERNGGFGSTVISKLLKMGLRSNLYYEIKDIVVEERMTNGIHPYKQKIRTKVYGLNSTKEVRKVLIDLLLERVEYHKDKIISPIIYNELLGMEVKRNGKVEHSATTHDDQVFSMLMALYVFYEGTSLYERFGIRKTVVKTDEDIDEAMEQYIDEGSVEIVGSFNQEDEIQEDIERDLEAARKAAGPTLGQFLEKRYAEESAQFNELVRTKLGERAYRQMYNIPDHLPIENYINTPNGYTVPDSVLFGFYEADDNTFMDYPESVRSRMTAAEADALALEDETYKYRNHFNF